MKINRIIDSLTLEEKIALVSGADQWRTVSIPRLDIPSIMVADGPHGLRKQATEGDNLGIGTSEKATCFPPAATIANSWDPALVETLGEAIGQEALAQEIAVVLGPGINIKRSPLCGRNFEYFSEDPFLTAELAIAWIKGIQGVGVGASLKHFAANNQESWRLVNDSIVDERALREIYLFPFEQTIIATKPWTVMAAYNKLNGTYCCEHPELLTTILRQEWGFTGAVISDWGAVNDPVLSIRAGMDLEMPASHGVSAARINADLLTGRLTESQLNRAVRNVLNLVDLAQAQKKADSTFDETKHHILARKIAAESAVLLKNEENILPLNKEHKFALIGEFARTPRYQGAGSSLVNPTKLDTILEQFELEQIKYEFARGYSLQHDETDEALIAEACQAAKKADIAIIFAGLPPQFESEGYDRTHLQMPAAHNELIERVSEVNPNVVVVLSAGSATKLPWLSQVKGVLHTYLSGQAGAGATVDLLFGKVNPSGKLAETYPLQLADHPLSQLFAADRKQTEYRESIFVGYRYYDAAEKEVLFPFGFGLSYTQFEYSNLKLSTSNAADDEVIEVSCTVKNAGQRGGAEVAQLYVGKRDSSLFRAPRELKGFQKVYLEAGESKRLKFNLDFRSFAYFNVEQADWHVEGGEYQISIGSSSRDLPLQTSLELTSSLPEVSVPDYRQAAPVYYSLAGKEKFPAADFLAIYGAKLPEVEATRPFHANSTLEDVQETRIGRLVARVVRSQLGSMIGVEDENDPLWIMAWKSILEMPFRSIAPLSGGEIPQHLVDALLAAVNGKYTEAVRHLVRKTS